MPTIYVRGVTGLNANSGSDWNNAKQTITSALTFRVAGDIIVVDNSEGFTQNGSINWVPTGINIPILSVARSGTTGWTKSPGAFESVGTGVANFTISGLTNGSIYLYGMRLVGTNANTATSTVGLLTNTSQSSTLVLDSCTIELPSPNAVAAMQLGATGASTSRSALISLRNCTLAVTGNRPSAGTAILLGDVSCEVVNLTCNYSGPGVPSALIGCSSLNDSAQLVVRNSNLSTINGAAVQTASFGNSSVLFKDCILPTGTITTGAFPQAASSITMRNCIQAGTRYPIWKQDPYGTLTVNTATFANGGAAVDGAPVSWQIVTSAFCSENTPFNTPLIEQQADSTGAKTVSIDVFRDSATALTDRDIWSEFDYPGASDVVYSLSTNRNADPIVGTPVNVPASPATWTNAATNPNPQRLSHSVTQGYPGLIQGRVSIAVPSATVFVNPVFAGL